MVGAIGAFFGSRLIYLFGLLVLLAAVAGVQSQYQKQTIKIPASHVPKLWCIDDGGTRSAYEFVWNRGVYHITCNDNTELTGGPN